MGQRSNPIGLRLGINRAADSRWFASDHALYSAWLLQDHQIREYLKGKFSHAGLSRIIINRSNGIVVTIMVAQAGVIIGKKGSVVDSVKDDLSKITKTNVRIDIQSIKNPDTDAMIIADSIAKKMEGHGHFKTHIKMAMQTAMRCGALGIKIMVKGRLNGVSIARFEEFIEGSVPLQKLRSQISYGASTSYTTSGTCGVKVWVHTGTILSYDPFEGTNEKF